LILDLCHIDQCIVVLSMSNIELIKADIYYRSVDFIVKFINGCFHLTCRNITFELICRKVFCEVCRMLECKYIVLFLIEFAICYVQFERIHSLVCCHTNPLHFHVGVRMLLKSRLLNFDSSCEVIRRLAHLMICTDVVVFSFGQRNPRGGLPTSAIKKVSSTY
jgi:hypothetical protein